MYYMYTCAICIHVRSMQGIVVQPPKLVMCDFATHDLFGKNDITQLHSVAHKVSNSSCMTKHIIVQSTELH